jgi:hypothetical protein
MLSFINLTKADDIKDFEIEGMSIGNSLLDFFDKKKILKSKVDWYDDREKNKYFSFAFGEKTFEKYDYVDVFTKHNDDNYNIKGVAGSIYFGKYKDFSDINDCYIQQKKIADQINKMFSNIEREGPTKITHISDKTGDSTYTDIYFIFENNYDITISCYDWSKLFEEERNRKDHFAIFIRSNELGEWLNSIN